TWRRWRGTGRPFTASPFGWALLLQLLGALVGVLVTVRLPTAGGRFAGLLAAVGLVCLTLGLAAGPVEMRRVLPAGVLLVGLRAPLLLLLAIPDDLETRRLPRPVSDWVIAAAPNLNELREAVLGLEGPIILQRFRLHSGGLSLAGAAGLGLALGPVLAPLCRR